MKNFKWIDYRNKILTEKYKKFGHHDKELKNLFKNKMAETIFYYIRLGKFFTFVYLFYFFIFYVCLDFTELNSWFFYFLFVSFGISIDLIYRLKVYFCNIVGNFITNLYSVKAFRNRLLKRITFIFFILGLVFINYDLLSQWNS